MSLSLDLAAALTPLVGQSFAPPMVVSVSDGNGMALSLLLTSVEAVGVSCEELRLEIPALATSTMDVLKRWAAGLCRRVTYLLETLQPLEFDEQGSEILIRSNPPDSTSFPGQTKYYEVQLSSQGGGQFTLQRFVAERGVPGRMPTPLRLTHEQLAKLVNDLVATLPSP